MRRILVNRGIPDSKLTVVPNVPNPSWIGSKVARGEDVTAKGQVLLYHGLVSDLYDLTAPVEAMSLLRDRGITDMTLEIVGDGPALTAIKQLVDAKGLSQNVKLHGRVSHNEMPGLLDRADAGIIPLADMPYTDLALPTKLLECVAAGRPVIVTRRKTIEHYFDEESVLFFAPEDAEDLTDAILRLRDDPERGRARARRAQAARNGLDWQTMTRTYLRVLGAGQMPPAANRSPHNGTLDTSDQRNAHDNSDTRGTIR